MQLPLRGAGAGLPLPGFMGWTVTVIAPPGAPPSAPDAAADEPGAPVANGAAAGSTVAGDAVGGGAAGGGGPVGPGPHLRMDIPGPTAAAILENIGAALHGLPNLPAALGLAGLPPRHQAENILANPSLLRAVQSPAECLWCLFVVPAPVSFSRCFPFHLFGALLASTYPAQVSDAAAAAPGLEAVAHQLRAAGANLTAALAIARARHAAEASSRFARTNAHAAALLAQGPPAQGTLHVPDPGAAAAATAAAAEAYGGAPTPAPTAGAAAADGSAGPAQPQPQAVEAAQAVEATAPSTSGPADPAARTKDFSGSPAAGSSVPTAAGVAAAPGVSGAAAASGPAAEASPTQPAGTEPPQAAKSAPTGSALAAARPIPARTDAAAAAAATAAPSLPAGVYQTVGPVPAAPAPRVQSAPQIQPVPRLQPMLRGPGSPGSPGLPLAPPQEEATPLFRAVVAGDVPAVQRELAHAMALRSDVFAAAAAVSGGGSGGGGGRPNPVDVLRSSRDGATTLLGVACRFGRAELAAMLTSEAYTNGHALPLRGGPADPTLPLGAYSWTSLLQHLLVAPSLAFASFTVPSI